jgi:hypothetical protein
VLNAISVTRMGSSTSRSDNILLAKGKGPVRMTEHVMTCRHLEVQRTRRAKKFWWIIWNFRQDLPERVLQLPCFPSRSQTHGDAYDAKASGEQVRGLRTTDWATSRLPGATAAIDEILSTGLNNVRQRADVASTLEAATTLRRSGDRAAEGWHLI